MYCSRNNIETREEICRHSKNTLKPTGGLCYRPFEDGGLGVIYIFYGFVLCTTKFGENRADLYGPRQANLVLIAYASSEGSGEPAHPRSLARTFAARSYKQ